MRPSGEKIGTIARIRNLGLLGHLLMQIIYAFRICSSAVSCTTLPFDNEVLQYTLMASLVAQLVKNPPAMWET